MHIININGPINSGKTTICKYLANTFTESIFIEVDSLLSDTEQEELHLNFQQGIEERLKRLDKTLIKHIKNKQPKMLIFAYPISENNYNRWREIIPSYIPFKVITLAPKQSTCTKNRGNRPLTSWEVKRIGEMYASGHANPPWSDLTIDNSELTVVQTCLQIETFLEKIGWKP